MKKIRNFLKIFFVVTVSGNVYKVEWTGAKTIVRLIFSLYPKNFEDIVGYELFPIGQYVGVSITLGLCKYQPNSGERLHLEDSWRGKCKPVARVAGFFFKEEPAIKYCKNNYDLYSKGKTAMNSEETISVLEGIGEDHPVFVISKSLLLEPEVA